MKNVSLVQGFVHTYNKHTKLHKNYLLDVVAALEDLEGDPFHLLPLSARLLLPLALELLLSLTLELDLFLGHKFSDGVIIFADYLSPW